MKIIYAHMVNGVSILLEYQFNIFNSQLFLKVNQRYTIALANDTDLRISVVLKAHLIETVSSIQTVGSQN